MRAVRKTPFDSLSELRFIIRFNSLLTCKIICIKPDVDLKSLQLISNLDSHGKISILM